MKKLAYLFPMGATHFSLASAFAEDRVDFKRSAIKREQF